MANSVNFNIKLTVNGKEQVVGASVAVEELRQAVDSSKGSVQAALSNFNNFGFAMQGIQSAVSQLSSTLNSLTAESRSFGAAMAAANTMAGKSGKDFENLKGQVAELAKEVPVARDALANGLYQVISNGVPEDNWIDFLKTSARSSVGGMAELDDVVKVTSTLIKNYGLSWKDAAAIQDKIQLTAKNGVTTFSEMAAALPRVSANAATLGVSTDELAASFATLTGVSGDTAEVSTQLAAIFTALIKPSSEAAEMAQQMGIEFDAASIKAAGGMQNFLASLSKSVSEYAKANGMLEQEIYGKLFGSAESLRAIVPLVGNLSDKYNENVGKMKDSTGEMDKAFEILGKTGTAQLQELKNKIAGVADVLTSAVGPALPVLNITTQVGMSVMAVKTLYQGITSLGIATKLSAFLLKYFGTMLTGVSVGARGAAVSVTTLKMAIRGLMIASAVGVAIVALTSVVEKLTNASDDAATSTDNFGEAEQAYQSTAAQTRVAIDQETKKLHSLIVAKQDTTQAVKNLNDKYGEVFGNHETAAEWYDILTRKSQIYARQLGYEAQMKVLSTQLAEKQIQLQDNKDQQRNLVKQGKAKQAASSPKITTGGGGVMLPSTYTEDTKEYAKLKTEAAELTTGINRLQNQLGIAQNKMAECAKQIRSVDAAGKKHNETLKVSSLNYNQVKDKIDEYRKRLGTVTNDPKEATRLNGIIKQLEARKKALEKTYSGLDSNSGKKTKHTPEPKFYKNPKTLGQLDKNINYYSAKISPNNTAEDQRLRKQIQAWKDKKTAIEMANKEAERPLKLESLDDYEKDMSILQDLIQHTKDTKKGEALQKEYNKDRQESNALKIKMGIESIPKIEVKKNVTKPISEQIKEDVEKLKIKPIKVETKADIKKKDLEKISNLFNIDTSNFNGVRNALESINGLSSSTSKGFATAGAACEALGGAMQQLGANSAAAKAGLVMAALGQLALSFAQAMNSASSNWITWLAFGIAGTAQLVSMVSTISQFATGGIVGGNETSGDKVLVRVNSGEMILNAAQQARLFALANGAAVYGASAQVATNFSQGASLPGVTIDAAKLQAIGSESPSGGKQAVSLRLRGRDLVGAIANETRSNRRRSNIRL